MKLTMNLGDLEPFDPTRDLKAVVAFGDAAADARACALLERLGRNCEAEGRLIFGAWNFVALSVSSLLRVAAREAAEADMIIIAPGNGWKLPEEARDWINLWLQIGARRTQALVALCEAQPRTNRTSGDICSQLKQVAQKGKMDFFTEATEGELQATLDRGPAPPSARESRRTEAFAPGMAAAGSRVAELKTRTASGTYFLPGFAAQAT